jgi:hypothetical protein
MLRQEFEALWQRYCSAGKPPPAEFLENENAVDNDALFALFASAVFLDRTLPGFYSHETPDGLFWSAPPL